MCVWVKKKRYFQEADLHDSRAVLGLKTLEKDRNLMYSVYLSKINFFRIILVLADTLKNWIDSEKLSPRRFGKIDAGYSDYTKTAGMDPDFSTCCVICQYSLHLVDVHNCICGSDRSSLCTGREPALIILKVKKPWSWQFAFQGLLMVPWEQRP